MERGLEILQQYGPESSEMCLIAAFGDYVVLRFLLNEIGLVPTEKLMYDAFKYRDRTTTAILLEKQGMSWCQNFHAQSVLISRFRAEEAVCAILGLHKVMSKDVSRIIARALWSDRINVKW